MYYVLKYILVMLIYSQLCQMSRTKILTKPVVSPVKRAGGDVATGRNDTQLKGKHTSPSSPGGGFFIAGWAIETQGQDVAYKKGGHMPLPQTIPYSRAGLAALQASLRLHLGLNQSLLWIDPTTASLTVKQVPDTHSLQRSSQARL